jgi:hypothetical protein
MSIKSLKPLFYLFVSILFLYLNHVFVFYFFDFKINKLILNYSLNELYVLFGLSSLIITFIILKIKQKNIDLVGNVFLLMTSFKSIGFYLLFKFSIKNLNNTFEKWNFLTLLLLFLILETVTTIYILNKK